MKAKRRASTYSRASSQSPKGSPGEVLIRSLARGAVRRVSVMARVGKWSDISDYEFLKRFSFEYRRMIDRGAGWRWWRV